MDLACYIKHATRRLLWSSEAPTLTRVLGPTQVNASTIHSYHTLVSSVCRHILTSNSVSWGKYSGFCIMVSKLSARIWGYGAGNLTLRGKKIGNQEIMSLLLRSIWSGTVLISTFSFPSTCGA